MLEGNIRAHITPGRSGIHVRGDGGVGVFVYLAMPGGTGSVPPPRPEPRIHLTRQNVRPEPRIHLTRQNVLEKMRALFFLFDDGDGPAAEDVDGLAKVGRI